jgi:hypothetical protein
LFLVKQLTNSKSGVIKTMTSETQTNETTITTGYCDICGTQETDCTETLKSEGWFLGSREEFCPACNS